MLSQLLLRLLLRLVPLRVPDLRPDDDLRPDVVRRPDPEACLVSAFCACSKSRFRAVVSLPLSRFASLTNLRRSCCSERVAVPASRPACLRKSVIAFCAASSDRLSCLTAAGSLKAADRRDVERPDAEDLRDVERPEDPRDGERLDFLAGGMWRLLRVNDGSRVAATLSHDVIAAHFRRWSQPGSNRRPPACKAGALPTELWPLAVECRALPALSSAVDVEISRRALLEPELVAVGLRIVGRGRGRVRVAVW